MKKKIEVKRMALFIRNRGKGAEGCSSERVNTGMNHFQPFFTLSENMVDFN
jgi:hypothetical protein